MSIGVRLQSHPNFSQLFTLCILYIHKNESRIAFKNNFKYSDGLAFGQAAEQCEGSGGASQTGGFHR
jgi:hypothetical protein